MISQLLLGAVSALIFLLSTWEIKFQFPNANESPFQCSNSICNDDALPSFELTEDDSCSYFDGYDDSTTTDIDSNDGVE